MANMTFKTNLLPNSNLGYSLGDSTHKWKINGVDDPKLTDTTYTFAGGENGSFTVTPSGGSAQTVSIGKPATAGVADSANAVTWSNISGKPSSYTPSSHSHSEIVTVGDKRNEATTPNSYTNKIVFQGLKTNSSFGSPSTDTYSYVIGLRGWSDSSGGDSHELAFNNTGLYWRRGATTSWGNWNRIYTTANKPTKSDVGLGNVENTALSTWAGSSNITTIGTLSSGTVPWARLSNVPTSMPASDVYAWAKASNKPTYSLSEITSADDLKAIEALTGTSGFLKKTAANTWALDTNTYLTSHQSLSDYAKLASPAFTGTPTAPTAANGTNNTQIATTAFVMNAFTANDAMVFKGVLGTESGMIAALPTTHSQGWTYKVGTVGTYAGQVCEIGDTIYCVADGTTANDAHWVILQTNVDGTVIGPAASTADHIATFTGTTGKVIKDSGFTIATSVPANAVFTDTNKYHKTGSWSGLTYTAQAVNSADELKFTIPSATTSAAGAVQLSSATNSTSETLAATAKAVKAAYDLAASKTSNTGTVISVAASGSDGITISGSPITTSGTLSIGLNLNTAINGLSEGTSTPVDADYYISQYVGGGTSTTTYHRRPMSALYNYIKGKINVTNDTINLSRNTETTIATIAGTPIKIKLPASDNTWRGVQNNLTSDATDQSLSAAQGKALKALIDGKTSNTGTVTSIATGAGLTGGTITELGTIKANLDSETSLGTLGTTSKLYAVGVDANGKLAVSVPWENSTYSLSSLGGVGSISASGIDPLTLSASKSGTTVTITGSVATVTTVSAGLMSAADKVKLNGITESADAVSFTRSLTSGTKIGTITINDTGTDLYCQTNTNTTYTFANGTNGFTVTPSGGTAQTVTVTPSITNNITGTGANGYLTKFNGTNTITNGPALGNSTTTFLRNDGIWATPPVISVAGKTGAVGLENLTIGHSIYNGSTPVDISIADLGLSSAITFLGVTTNNIQKPNNGVYDTTNPITLISGNIITAIDGNVVLVKSSGEEFLWTENHWEPLGLATSYALSNHLHGNITSQGAITKEGIELQSGDQLLFANYDNSGKIEKTAISFDGSTTNEFLSRKGTWEAAPDASTSQKGIVQLVDSVSSTATNMAATARAVNEAYQAVAGKVNKSGDTMTGPLTVNVLKGTNGVDYGGVLPVTATEGQIFFQTSTPYYELPGGGLTGQFLVKNSNDDRDVKWQSLNTNSVSKLGDTMEGILVAQNNTNYTTKQVRNIIISKAAPSGGSNGDIWIQYVN